MGVKENNGTPEVMFLIDLLSDYSMIEIGFDALIRVIDNIIKIQNERLLQDNYIDQMLDFRQRIKGDAKVYSRYQELLQVEITDELEQPKKMPMLLRLQNLLGDDLINIRVPK